MARTPNTPKKNRSFRIHVDIPGELAVLLDEKAHELTQKAEVPGEVITRSDVVRRAIAMFVKEAK